MSSSDSRVLAEVSGSVWKIEVTEGQQVAEGDTLLVLESMKMEIPVTAPRAGTVTDIRVAEGDAVEDEQLLLTLI
jgi:acetyl-CoA carboxylase biotin carboxyl carrier protein